MKKFNLVKSMNEIVISMNNEDAYMWWITIVPDCADEDDLKDIADDEELFAEATNMFIKICKYFLKDGLYVNKKLYTGE